MRKTKILAIIIALFLISVFTPIKEATAHMPFYGLNPQKTVLRAQFSTEYTDSSDARKHNIKLASKSLNNVLIDAGAEFSFNLAVGERTARRGYESAKIIVGDGFVDGIGGGVCQVSTTLYNAAVLAGLKITEVHAHTLPVKYIAPSFDAMVNSGAADLKFINDTDNPLIIECFANGKIINVKIYGQPLLRKITRESEITEKISPPPPEILIDENGEYPELKQGDSITVKSAREGIKSAGYLIEKYPDGKMVKKRIRKDYYKEVRGKIVIGKATPEKDAEQKENK